MAAALSLADAKVSNDCADLSGKHALLVGGTSGCGKGVALVLARRGCKITIVGRNAERGAEAKAEIEAVSPTSLACDFVSCDVRSFASIKSACTQIIAAQGDAALDLVCLSCTRGGVQGYRPTSEGFDERLMTMYLGRYAWVHCLLPLILKSPDPRILSILSAGHHKPHASYQTDFLTRKCGMAGRTYAAGWYNDCAISALARAHPQLITVHAFPGFVSTNWYLELPQPLRCLTRLLMRSGKSLQDCGEWMAQPLLAPKLARGCHLRTEFAAAEKPTAVWDDVTCDDVWRRTVEIYAAHLA